MPCSKVDLIYRSLLLSKFFVKGWGDPDVLKKLLEFRRVVSKKGECYNLVPEYYPVNITKERILNNLKIIEGYFISPFDQYFPDFLPAETKTAYFQMLLPLEWKSERYKPVCLHMAGTGDHYFWRRRQFMAKPLLVEGGIGSIIIENPFYGLRKPRTQVRSVLHNVTDIFLIGICLMMEAIVLFNWCNRNGFGPLGVTGISMGGHVASLAATCWPFPIVVVPCLSWSTASGVFTKGVMSKSINWDLLINQIRNIDGYNIEFPNVQTSILHDHLCEHDNSTHNFRRLNELAANDVSSQFLKNFNISTVLKQNRNFETIRENLPAISYFNKLLRKVYRKHTRNSIHYQEALRFMKIIMDECTHLSNYPVPLDTSLVICLCALHDGYVPREGVDDLAHVWPGVEIRYLRGGHISAFLFNQKAFRAAIIEGFHRYQTKYL